MDEINFEIEVEFLIEICFNYSEIKRYIMALAVYQS